MKGTHCVEVLWVWAQHGPCTRPSGAAAGEPPLTLPPRCPLSQQGYGLYDESAGAGAAYGAQAGKGDKGEGLYGQQQAAQQAYGQQGYGQQYGAQVRAGVQL